MEDEALALGNNAAGGAYVPWRDVPASHSAKALYCGSSANVHGTVPRTVHDSYFLKRRRPLPQDVHCLPYACCSLIGAIGRSGSTYCCLLEIKLLTPEPANG